MGRSAILSVQILVDAAKASKDIDAAGKKVGGFADGIGKAALPAAAVVGGIAAIGKASLDAASDSQQAMGAIDSVFGKNADQVQQWAKDGAKNVGLSTTQYGNLASKLGASFKNMGLSTDQASQSTQEMIALGADLAATFGGTTEEAVSALSAALRGEADPAERYGLALSQTAINAELAAKGQDKLTGAAKNQARAAAITAKATKDAAGAVGQFGRESDTASGSAQIASAQWENTKAVLGEQLLPIAAKASEIFAKLAGWMQENSRVVSILIGVVGGLAVAVLAVNTAMKLVSAASSLIGLATNPIGLIVIAIVAVIAAVVLLWNKCEWFRNAVIAVWNAIKTAAVAVWNAIKIAVSAVVTAITKAVQTAGRVISGVWNAIRTAAIAVWNAIKTAVSAVISAVTKIVSAAGATIRGIWSGIRTAAVTAWNAIKAPIKAVYDWIVNLWRNFMVWLATLWAHLAGIASTAWNTIKKPIDTVYQWVMELWRKFSKWLATLWAGLVGIATAAWNTIKAPIQTVYDWIIRLWDGLVGALSAVWGRIAGAVSSALQPIKDAIQSIRDLWDRTVGAIEGAIGKVKGWISGIKSGISGVIDKINPFMVVPPGGGAVVTPRSVMGRGAGAGAAGPQRFGAASGNGVHIERITINGAVDPDRTARQIQLILTGRARRVGPISLGGVLA